VVVVVVVVVVNLMSTCVLCGEWCERSVGTVFQLPNPDAIYRRDEEKKRDVGGYCACWGWRTTYILLAAGVIVSDIRAIGELEGLSDIRSAERS
jgi:hypothetical protein